MQAAPACTSPVLEEVLHRLTIWRQAENHAAGVQLFAQLTVADAVYYVRSGLVKLTRIGHTGSETIIGVRREHSLLGVEEATSGGGYVANAITVKDSSIHKIAASQFMQAIRSDPDLSFLIHRILTRQSLETMRHCGRLGGDSSRDRLLAYLSDLAATGGFMTATGRVQLPMREWEVAQWLAVTPWHLSRMLRDCEAEGILQRDRGWLVIRDVNRLCHSAAE
jgi:CRP/FNR family transcriptional regulator